MRETERGGLGRKADGCEEERRREEEEAQTLKVTKAGRRKKDVKDKESASEATRTLLVDLTFKSLPEPVVMFKS